MREAGDHASDLSLPNLTRILARPARSLGVFGLVGGPLTILYHVSILGQTRGQNTITNHYRRGEGITHTDESVCYVGLL